MPLRILRSGYTGLIAIALVIIGPALVVIAVEFDVYGDLVPEQKTALFFTSLVAGALLVVIGVALGIAVLVVRARSRRPA